MSPAAEAQAQSLGTCLLGLSLCETLGLGRRPGKCSAWGRRHRATFSNLELAPEG